MDNQNGNVWIDRQEYDRLKALDSQPQTAPIGFEPSQAATAQPVAAPPESSKNTLTILTGIFAVVSFIFPPAILVFLGLGIASLVKFFKGGATGKTKMGVGIAVGIGVALLLIVAGPFILLFAFIIMWQIGCWTGLGSCTTA